MRALSSCCVRAAVGAAAAQAVAQQVDDIESACRAELRRVEATFAEGRRTLMAARRQRLDRLLERRSAAEQQCLERGITAADARAAGLAELHACNAEEYNDLKARQVTGSPPC